MKPGPPADLECAATGDPLPEITWSLNNEPITRDVNKFQVKIESNDNGILTSKLSVLRVETIDGGVYGCTARNKVGSLSHARRLDVYGVPSVKPLANVTVISGQQIRLTCFYSGYPVKEISWLKG